MYISGIQQIGIGVEDVIQGWNWYGRHFGVDIQVFNDDSVAELMLPYTNNQKCRRHAILAVTLNGGGGFEIWQHKEHVPEFSAFEVLAGDFGIFCPKVKTGNITEAFSYFSSIKANIGESISEFEGRKHFFIKDPFGNYFQVVENGDLFTKGNHPNAGVAGCIIGVSDINKSKEFYSDILGYDKIIYEKEGVFTDLKDIPGGKNSFRRVLLTHTAPRKGAFSKFLGHSYIELLKVEDRKPNKIFGNRLWGDPGFIHLCFDIKGMDEMRELCKSKGYPFTVDTGKGFDMGDASGHFSYIEDDDGTLIEFVETHKLPVIKKLGLFYNLKKRSSDKPLPDWMVKTLRFNRKKIHNN